MVLDNTAFPNTKRAQRAESIYHLPSLLYCMEKQEKKLIKLAMKAQECVSRKKANKILKKVSKVRGKMTKMSEGIAIENDSHYPP